MFDFYQRLEPVSVTEFARRHPDVIGLEKPVRAMRKRLQGVTMALDFHVSWTEGADHHCKCFQANERAAFLFATALGIMADVRDC